MERIPISTICESVPYLSFGDIAELDFSENQIIWSPNGTGKTSIVKALSAKGGLPISFADLEASRSDFIKNGKQLVISLGIRRIDELSVANASILGACDTKKRLKSAGIGNQTDAKRHLPEYPRCTSDAAETFLSFKRSAALRLIGTLRYSDLKFYVSNRSKLTQLDDIRREIEELKGSFIKHALENLQHVIDSDTKFCPVCGKESDKPILEVIQQKIEEYESDKESLAIEYSKAFPSLTVEEIESRISELCNIQATDEELLSFILCQGDRVVCDSISKQKTQFKSNEASIRLLAGENERFYAHLKKREAELRSIFTSRFDVQGLKLDDEQMQLIISLPRNVETYSTGEINLMITLVRINEFLASDNEVMIFDDPLSSLDRANQYLVMFELIRAGKSDDYPEKRITIFTHNMDCVTIAESQFSRSFKYLCLEKLHGELLLNRIDSRFFEVVKDACKNPDFSKDGARPGALCAESILLYRKQNPGDEMIASLISYLDLVRDRDVNDCHDAHKVFHYRGSFVHPTLGLSNDFLVESIDNFRVETLSRVSFADRTIQKMFLFVALRTWVEKQFYLHYPELFCQAETQTEIGKLIKKAFLLGPWRGPGTVTKEFLNSKKTMLNHSSHAKAQASPFDFAINLSIDDICSEIEEIKGAFVDSN